jgi:hypothetical protein
MFRLIYLVPLLGGLVWWNYFSNGEYFHVTMGVIFSGITSGGRSVPVSEMVSLWPSLFLNLFVVIPFVMFFRRDIKPGLTAIYFLMTNQIRYLEAALPIMVNYLRYLKFKPGILVLFSLISLSILMRVPPTVSKDCAFVLNNRFPDNSRVFDLGWNKHTILHYANPSLKIAPSFEIEWMSKDLIQIISLANSKGKFDCKKFALYDFDYVVESNLLEKPACLELVDVAGKLRIWKPISNKSRNLTP